MYLTRNHLEKLEALAATGMPGAYKFLTFFLIQEIYGLSLLGSIATWQSAAQIMGFITAIGWGSLILVRVPKATTDSEKINTFNSLLKMGLMTLTVFISLLLFLGEVFGKQTEAIEISLWLSAWTLYQLPRHYLVAKKKYRNTLALDLTIIAASIISIVTTPTSTASISLAGCMLICGTISIMLIQKPTKPQTPRTRFDIKGIEYGFANLLTGGITLSVIPLASHFEGKDFAGAISLFIAISGIALLIPRAISINQLPTLAEKASQKDELKKITRIMQRQITLSNLATTAICTGIAIYIAQSNANILPEWKVCATLLLLIIQSSVSTQSLVHASTLMANESSRAILTINTASFIVFLFSIFAAYLAEKSAGILIICTTLAAISVLRLYAMKSKAKI